MSYQLNKLVKKGLLDVKREGEGEGMRGIRGHNHSITWFKKGVLNESPKIKERTFKL